MLSWFWEVCIYNTSADSGQNRKPSMAAAMLVPVPLERIFTSGRATPLKYAHPRLIHSQLKFLVYRNSIGCCPDSFLLYARKSGPETRKCRIEDLSVGLTNNRSWRYIGHCPLGPPCPACLEYVTSPTTRNVGQKYYNYVSRTKICDKFGGAIYIYTHTRNA